METTNNKLKIIFLDFDGVITWPGSRWNIDLEKVKLLEQLIENTGAKIVVSSSWRHGTRNGEEFIKYRILNSSHVPKQLDENCLFLKSIIDVTDSNGSMRGDEIKRWVESHDVENYVILDDDSDMLDEQLFHFVQTDGWYGISDRTVYLATQILNGEKIINPIRLNTELTLKWRLNINGEKNNITDLLLEYETNFKEKK